MARLADTFNAIDADDLLRPVRDPAEIALVWKDGARSTCWIALTFTETAFNGRRVWFVCPACKMRRRKLYQDGLYRVLRCRRCLGLRYRSQERRLSQGARSFLEPMEY